MVLENLVNGIKNTHRKLSEKFDHLYYSSLAFLSVNGLDALSTSSLAHRYGIDGEQNNLAKYCMEQFGIDAGLIIHKIPLVAAMLGAGYLLNGLNQHSDSRWVRNLGSTMVYGITLTGVPVVINNFLQYFK